MPLLLLLTSACVPEPEPTAALSTSIPTVVLVEAETPEDAVVFVEFGESADFGMHTPPTSGTTHGHQLLGIPAGVEVHYRLVVDGVPLDTHLIETGLWSSDIPDLTVVNSDATWEGFLVTTLVGVWSGPVVLDPQGRIVWAWQEPEATQSLAIRAYARRGGAGVIFNRVSNGEADEVGALHSVDWAGIEHTRINAPGQSHDFVELEDGGRASILYAREEVEGTLVRGDMIAEIGRDTLEEVWNAWDWYTPGEDGEVHDEGDWTHANALHQDGDAYVLGLRDLDRIVRIDAATGTLTETLGAEDSDWLITDDERPFRYQHQFDWVDDHIVLFDNGNRDDDAARVVEYALDPETRVGTKVWSRTFDPPQWIYALGDVDRLDDGSTLISWGVAGRLEQVHEDEVLWQVEASVGTAFGYLSRVDTLYPGN